MEGYIFSSYCIDKLYIDYVPQHNIIIPHSITEIRDYAFCGIRSIYSVEFHDSVTRIGEFAFWGTEICSIDIPDSVTSVGVAAFANCEHLESVRLSENIDEIPSSMFDSCPGLTSITIPDYVHGIGMRAFANCYNLSSVTIGRNTTEICEDAFAACDAIEDVYFNCDIETWHYINIFDGNESLTEARLHIGESLVDSNGFMYVIEDDCVTITGYIGEDAFITIPSTIEGYLVTNIGNSSFENCNNLVSVTISEGVRCIEEKAFMSCDELVSVTLPDSLTTISDNAFDCCLKLSSIELPRTLQHIGSNAFCACISLTEITIPHSVETIGTSPFVACHSLNAITVEADNDNYVSDEYGVLFNKDKTVLIQYPCARSGEYIIPENVVTISDWAFFDARQLTSVIMGDNVKNIGTNAFANCYELNSIEISDNVTTISNGAFCTCVKLTEISIPNSVTEIGECAFGECYALTDVYYNGTEEEWNKIVIAEDNGELDNVTIHFKENSTNPEDFTYAIIDGEVTITGYTGTDKEVIIPSTIEGCPVTKIGDNAFGENFNITSVVIPEGVKEIGALAFISCQALTSVTLPDSVTTIGEQAFNCCIGLTEIDLPDNLQTIGALAFAYCTNLKTITIPNSVTTIGHGPFTMCLSLESIKVEEGNSAYLNDKYGVLYNADTTTLVQYPCARAGIYIIPDSVITIGYAAFFGAMSLTSVDMGANVKYVEDYAFYCCENLTSIEIPEGLTEINFGSFAATGVSELVIPEGVKTIGCGAFDSSENLVSVTIPVSVTFIDESAFNSCSALTEVYYNGTEYEWNRITIAEDNEELTDATIRFKEISTDPGYFTYTIKNDKVTITGYIGFEMDVVIPSRIEGYPVTEIGGSAFEECTSLRKITIGKNVTSIGSSAFDSCYALEEVIIPDSVTSIEGSAFYECESLKTITIPAGVKSIGVEVFVNCVSLESIVVDDNNSYYCSDDYGVLYNKNKTVLIQYPVGNSRTIFEIPYGVASISGHAFYNCDNLKSVTIPDTVKNIVSYAFYGCDGLESITIPDSVTSIGSYAFQSCSVLKSIAIPGSVTSIGYSAFDGCNDLSEVYYDGTKEDWSKIVIGSENDELLNATIYYLREPCEHEYAVTITEPTCTEQGYSTYTCSACSDTFIADEVPALGHVEGEWRVTKPAEVGVAGEETLYCEVCEEILSTREIPAIQACAKEVEGSTTVIDKERGYIYGLEEGIYNLDGFVDFEGGTIEYVESEWGFGTGTVVNFVVNGEIIESYTIVIFGDVTGDGVIDTFDAANLAEVVNGDREVAEDSAEYFAADIAWGDEVADTYDLATLYAVVNGDMTISQVA